MILGAAAAANILDPRQVSSSIAIVICTLVISPLLIGPAHLWSEKLVRIGPARWVKTHALREQPVAAPPPQPEGPPDAQPQAAPCHVIIAGFGSCGAHARGRPVRRARYSLYGDRAGTAGPWKRPGHHRTPDHLRGRIDQPGSAGVGRNTAGRRHHPHDPRRRGDTSAPVRRCARMAPDIFIAARTSFLSGKFIAHQLGADMVTVEELATAQADGGGSPGSAWPVETQRRQAGVAADCAGLESFQRGALRREDGASCARPSGANGLHACRSASSRCRRGRATPARHAGPPRR